MTGQETAVAYVRGKIGVLTALDRILKPQLPDQLYHYTSFRGLLGIVKSKSLWASDIHYLNDEQELDFGLATIREVIEERTKSARDEHDSMLLQELSSHMDNLARTKVLVASFSEVDDLLSQWRGYCPNGKGVSIGFYADDLDKAAELQHFRLVKVVYGQSVARDVAIELVDTARGMDTSGGAKALSGIADIFAFQLGLVVPALKHHAFSEEREWRLVSPLMSTQRQHLRVRETDGRLVPYLAFVLAESEHNLRMSHVRVGPASDRGRALEGTQDALGIYGVDCETVLLSDVPYRE